MRSFLVLLLVVAGCGTDAVAASDPADAGADAATARDPADAAARVPPQTAVVAALGLQAVATPGFESCPASSSPPLRIGSFPSRTQEQTQVVIDGEEVDGAPVHVTCSVVPNGDGFAVNVEAQAAEGELRVHGTFGTSGEQRAVEATFRSAEFGRYVARECVVSYYDAGEDTSQPSYRGVAAGRVWGFLTCDSAENAQSNRACRATAQFRFENCTQK